MFKKNYIKLTQLQYDGILNRLHILEESVIRLSPSRTEIKRSLTPPIREYKRDTKDTKDYLY